MPSRFPGMDPWLESSILWRGFQLRFVNAASDLLQPELLVAGFFVDIDAREYETEVREPYLKIYDQRSRLVITQIELISPTNKTAPGREFYVQKRDELKDGGVNIVEIDLLRQSPPVVDLWPHALNELRPWDYMVCVNRQGSAFRETYPIGLRQRLPRVRIPLRTTVPDVVLDLQAAVSRAYDSGPYRVRIDYRQPPEPELPEADRGWADEILREAGMR